MRGHAVLIWKCLKFLPGSVSSFWLPSIVTMQPPFFFQLRFKFTHHARVREAHACGSVQQDLAARWCASRPRQGGVLSHPTWRFQFHFLSRRFPSVPPSHLRPPCGSDPGSGVVSHPTPYYSLNAARRCKDREIHAEFPRSSGSIGAIVPVIRASAGNREESRDLAES